MHFVRPCFPAAGFPTRIKPLGVSSLFFNSTSADSLSPVKDGSGRTAPAPGSARLSRDWASRGLANGFPRAPATGVFLEHKRFVKHPLIFTERELFLPASSLGCGSVPGQHPIFGGVCVHLKARETTRFSGRSMGLEREGPRARASPAFRRFFCGPLSPHCGAEPDANSGFPRGPRRAAADPSAAGSLIIEAPDFCPNNASPRPPWGRPRPRPRNDRPARKGNSDWEPRKHFSPSFQRRKPERFSSF